MTPVTQLIKEREAKFVDFWWETGEFEHRELGIKQYQDFNRTTISLLLDTIEQEVPEEGIKWMQEGSDKKKKGYTDGFNDCRNRLISLLSATKKEIE